MQLAFLTCSLATTLSNFANLKNKHLINNNKRPLCGFCNPEASCTNRAISTATGQICSFLILAQIDLFSTVFIFTTSDNAVFDEAKNLSVE